MITGDYRGGGVKKKADFFDYVRYELIYVVYHFS